MIGKETRCDMCGEIMEGIIENCTLTYIGQEYHADAFVYRCQCGYKKLGTCDVHIMLNDEPNEEDNYSNSQKVPGIAGNAKAGRESGTGKRIEAGVERDGLFHPKGDAAFQKQAVGMPFPFDNGKYILSDAWLDWMLERHAWFQKPYERLISFGRRQERYFTGRKPDYRAIHDDVLYDTGKADLFYEETIRDGKAIIKRYYYDAGNGRYFCIRSKYGESDDFDVKSVSDIKRLLKKQPDIYVKVIHEKVENIDSELAVEGRNDPADKQEQENVSKRSKSRSQQDPTNRRKPLT